MKSIMTFLVCAIILLSAPHDAQAFPDRPVTIVTNLSVGSGPDVFVRRLSLLLEAHWKVPVLVENKPGAAGIIALEHFLKMPPNGHYIFYGDNGIFVTTPILYNKENLIQRIQPLTIAYNSAWMIITPPDVKNFNDLKTKLRKNPKFGSWNVGSGGHLCGQELSALINVNATHVPYREHGTWFVDTVNGLMSFGCTSVGSSESYHRAGKLNYVATTAAQRDPAFPDVPTLRELTGRPFETGEVFSAFYTHTELDRQKASKLENDLRTFIQHPDIVNVVRTLRGMPASNNSAEMARLRNERVEQYKKIIKKYNITID